MVFMNLPKNIQYKILSFCSDEVMTSMINVSNSMRKLVDSYNEFTYSLGFFKSWIRDSRTELWTLYDLIIRL